MSKLKIFIATFSLFFILFLVASIFQVADEEIDNAINLTQKNLYNTTLLLAFIGGVLTIFAPCLMPILVVYFAYTFKTKKELTKNTLLFFLGFITVFIPFGFSISYLGQLLRIYYSQLTLLSGIAIVIFGLLTVFGRGFSLIKHHLPTNKITNTYLLGILFTIGWAPCVGPILFSILFLAANMPNMLYTGLLLLSYSVGMWIPLFIASYFYDKQQIHKNKWINGREMRLSSRFSVNSTNLISGFLLITLGLVYIIFNGTQILNVKSLWSLSYVVQGIMLSSELLKDIGNYLGFLLLALAVIAVIYLYKNQINGREK